MYLQSLYCLKIYNFINQCGISHGFHRLSMKREVSGSFNCTIIDLKANIYNTPTMKY